MKKVQEFNYTPSKFAPTSASGLRKAMIQTSARLKINSTTALYKFKRNG